VLRDPLQPRGETESRPQMREEHIHTIFFAYADFGMCKLSVQSETVFYLNCTKYLFTIVMFVSNNNNNKKSKIKKIRQQLPGSVNSIDVLLVLRHLS